jgi:hypothetical protein
LLETLGTVTVQFIQLERVPAVDVALIDKEIVPADVGVPDMAVPVQAAETEVKVADSFTVGVYE